MNAMIDRTIDSATHVLSENWGGGASINIPYPRARSAATYQYGTLHRIVTHTYNLMEAPRQLRFTFGPTQITITNLTGTTLLAGTTLFIELDRAGMEFAGDPLANPDQMADMKLVLIDLGTPVASSSTAVCLSQACTAADGLETGINGASASGGVATFDVPRNVVAAWTGTAVLTVTGEDQYGNVMVESSGSGTSMAGKKAFKRVTGISASADVTGLTVGNSKVLGLPVFIGLGSVIREIDNNAVVTNGTLAVGDGAAPTATTGDVRGTYSPNSNPNGTKRTQLIAMVASTAFKGLPQFAG